MDSSTGYLARLHSGIKRAQFDRGHNSVNQPMTPRHQPHVACTPLSSMISAYPLRKAERFVFQSVCLWAVLMALLSASSMAQQQSGHSQTILTRAGQVHDLPPGQAANTRVHLSGTVTYYDPSDGIMFFQDATGGVYVNTDKTYLVHNGDQVILDGFASPSYRTEIANDPEITVVGPKKSIPAVSLDYNDLVTGLGDCKMVTVRGVVRAADVEQHLNTRDLSVHLDLAMPDGEVQVYIHPNPNFLPESLLDSTVAITGVEGGAFDAKNQLTGVIVYAPDPGSIQVLQKPSVTARKLPLTAIDDVFQSRRLNDLSRPIRVQGSITYYKKGDSAVLEDNGKSIFVQTRGTTDLSLGDVVDAIGFASDHEYAPSLRQASLLKTGRFHKVDPKPVTYADAASGRYSDNLISITGELVSQLQDADSYALVINSDDHLVTAYLSGKTDIAKFELGSHLRISGICRIVPGGAWRTAYLSHIEMRGADDVQLVSKPAWYSLEHLLEISTVLIIIAMVIAVWAGVLKRRVVNQTAWIDRSVIVARERSRILEMISRNHTLDELLTEICKSTMELLPGTICSYKLELNDDGLQIESEQKPLARGSKIIYEVPLPDSNGKVVGHIVVSTNDSHLLASDHEEIYDVLSELSALAMRQSLLYLGLVHHSTHDPLTELPNRRLFESRLASTISEAEQKDGQLAVIYIDINRFKFVNDKYGHKAGDLYLQQISQRLQQQIRPIDMLARIGGDEFVVVAPFAEGIDRSEALTARLQACFDEQFDLDGQKIDGSASFGYARYPEHGRTAEDLTRHADHAMYIAKHNDARVTEEAHGLAIITSDELELALLRHRFRLAYQPQFSATGQLTGLEALIRLDDPVLGIITPDAFISVAERHPVIVGIGAWALRCALEDAVRWKLDKGDPVTIAVNVSVRQLEEPGYADSVMECLRECNFPPERLEIELIERSLMFSGDHVLNQLDKLREKGVRISLDDFGTGQSCLSLLHRLPIDTIKLDRSFIQAMDDEPRVLPIIQAIVSMSHSLGKRIVAEAVEHEGPIPTLMQMGKMDFQGYLLSRPVPAEDVHTLIDKWRSGIVMPPAFRQPVLTNVNAAPSPSPNSNLSSNLRMIS